MNKLLTLAILAVFPFVSLSQEFKRNTFNYDSLPSENFPSCDDKVIDVLAQSFDAVDQNNSTFAVENAKKVFDVNKGCYSIYETYGYSLFRNGKWLEGVEILEEGIRKFGSVPELIKRKADMSLEMAEMGIGANNIDGSAVYKKTDWEYDEDQFIRENYNSALADLNYLMITYNRTEEMYYVAKLYQILERYDESTETFSKLLTNEDYKIDAMLNIAENHIAQDKLDEAERSLLEIIALYPKMGAALKKLGEIAEKNGQTEQALEYRKKAIFYKNIADFVEFEYSKENFDLLVLFGTDESSPEEKMNKLNEIYSANDPKFTIDICLTILELHANHGNGVEEKATEILSEIGKPAIEKVNLLFQEQVSTCTITNLAEVMATVKDERSWELMMLYLPSIATMPMTTIPPNLPEKMVKFDQKKGVKEILLVVKPLLTKKKDDGPMAEFFSIGQFVYYSPLKDIKRSKLLKTAKKLGYSAEELTLLEKKID